MRRFYVNSVAEKYRFAKIISLILYVIVMLVVIWLVDKYFDTRTWIETPFYKWVENTYFIVRLGVWLIYGFLAVGFFYMIISATNFFAHLFVNKYVRIRLTK